MQERKKMLKQWLLILVYILSNGICLQSNGMDPWAFLMPEGLPSYELTSAERNLAEAKQHLMEYETLRHNYQMQLQNNYSRIDKLNQDIETLNKNCQNAKTDNEQITLALKISIEVPQLEEQLKIINEENAKILEEFDKTIQKLAGQKQDIQELEANFEAKRDEVQKEFGDIIAVANAHRTQAAYGPQPDKPVEIATENNDKIIIQPALQQPLKGEPEDVTAYCGYYSLWSAFCFSNRFDNDIRLNRNLFCNMLERMLIEIRQWLGQEQNRKEDLKKENPADRYAWATRNEMRHLVEKFNLPYTIVVELQMLFLPKVLSMSPEDALENTHAATLIKNFTDQKIDRLVIILVTGRQKGHYITILAERKEDGSIELSIADSLPGSLKDIEKIKELEQRLANLYKSAPKTEQEQNKTLEKIQNLDQQLENLNRGNRILPLYYALKGQWDKLTQEYASSLGFSLND
jgi:predicted  nucleic acid-binding Zn-ribbon protein